MALVVCAVFYAYAINTGELAHDDITRDITLDSTYSDQDYFSDDFLLDDLYSDDIDRDCTLPSSPCAFTPSDIACLLVSVGAVTLLDQELYLKTYPLNERSLLTLPLFLPLRFGNYGWTVGTHLFWNQTSRMFFTRKSSSLCSYVGINQPTLLDKVASLAVLQQFFPKAEKIFPLFKNMTVNERRLGLMFHAQKEGERTRFRITTPLYYLERNFFLTEQEQTAVEQALGQTTDAEQMDFAKKHLICDQLGLGDTRIVAEYKPCIDTPVDTTLGLFATVPTAFCFAKGFLGSSFSDVCTPAPLSIEELLARYCSGGADGQAEVLKKAECFALGALDTFAATLLNRPLGNYGHFGLGAQYTSITPLNIFVKLPWAEDVVFKSRVSLEYFFPAVEKRFFVERECSRRAAFAALGLDRPQQVIIDKIQSDPAYGAAVLAFIEREFTEKLYPFPFKARISPGIEFQYTSKACYEGKKWGFYLGTDTWVKTGEKISKVKKTGNRPTTIDFEKATRRFAYQFKVLAGTSYTISRKSADITLSLNADNTTISSGIGQDFTVSFNIECNF